MEEEPHLSFDQVTMPLAVNFLIVQKDTVLGSRAHKMIVACTGSEAAAYRGARLLAELASLQKQTKTNQNKKVKN